jgi:ubiquinone biosynthesis protein
VAGALEDFGPVFAAFGRYLGGRPDLFRVSDALALAATPFVAFSWPPDAVRARVAGELGAPPEELFAAFDPAPVRSTLPFDEHRARLPDGSPAAVRIARAGDGSEWTGDLELLPLLEPALHPVARREGWIAEAAERFGAEMLRLRDLGRTAEELDRLAASRSFGASGAVPAVVRHLSTPRLLTVVPPSGTPLTGLRAGARVERLVDAWLTQVVFESGFVLDPGRAVILPDGRVGFEAGSLDSVPREVSERLLEYLAAVAAHDVERASDALAALSAPAPSAEELRELRRRLRSAVPLRIDPDGAGGEGLLTEVLTHAAVLGACGLRPRRGLLAVYRGLLSIRRPVDGGPADRDPLAGALRNVHLRLGWERARGLLPPERLLEWASRNASAAVAFPKVLDRVLDRALDRSEAGWLDRPEAPPPGGRPALRGGAAVLLLLVGGLFAAVEVPREIWDERLAATIFLVFGVALVRVLGGPR